MITIIGQVPRIKRLERLVLWMSKMSFTLGLTWYINQFNLKITDNWNIMEFDTLASFLSEAPPYSFIDIVWGSQIAPFLCSVYLSITAAVWVTGLVVKKKKTLFIGKLHFFSTETIYTISTWQDRPRLKDKMGCWAWISKEAAFY